MSKCQMCGMPTELTAQNGAKYLLIGEFTETVEFKHTNSEGEDQRLEVVISWTTIKDIYRKIVDHYGE